MWFGIEVLVRLVVWKVFFEFVLIFGVIVGIFVWFVVIKGFGLLVLGFVLGKIIFVSYAF